MELIDRLNILAVNSHLAQSAHRAHGWINGIHSDDRRLSRRDARSNYNVKETQERANNYARSVIEFNHECSRSRHRFVLQY